MSYKRYKAISCTRVGTKTELSILINNPISNEVQQHYYFAYTYIIHISAHLRLFVNGYTFDKLNGMLWVHAIIWKILNTASCGSFDITLHELLTRDQNFRFKNLRVDEEKRVIFVIHTIFGDNGSIKLWITCISHCQKKT